LHFQIAVLVILVLPRIAQGTHLTSIRGDG
jgi:hypothetical protein